VGTSFLLHSCAEVREPIELSFEVVSRVGPGIDVLDGGRCAASKGKGRGLGGNSEFSPFHSMAHC